MQRAMEQRFHELAPLPAADRVLVLGTMQPAERGELERMLAHHDAARREAFLEGPCSVPASTPCPAHVGHWRILGPLGKGGMGSVYRAEHRLSGVRAALKLCVRAVLDTHRPEAPFAEAAILAGFAHDCVCRLHETGFVHTAAGTVPYLVMELVDGATLLDHAAGRAMPLRQRLQLLARVADAVQCVHDRGIAHRDLTPANILVAACSDAVGRPKLVDFGAACAIGEIASVRAGTPKYMSPEQRRADSPADARSDVFALGVIGDELTGCRAPGELHALLSRARAETIGERVQSAAEFAAELRRCSAVVPA